MGKKEKNTIWYLKLSEDGTSWVENDDAIVEVARNNELSIIIQEMILWIISKVENNYPLIIKLFPKLVATIVAAVVGALSGNTTAAIFSLQAVEGLLRAIEKKYWPLQNKNIPAKEDENAELKKRIITARLKLLLAKIENHTIFLQENASASSSQVDNSDEQKNNKAELESVIKNIKTIINPLPENASASSSQVDNSAEVSPIPLNSPRLPRSLVRKAGPVVPPKPKKVALAQFHSWNQDSANIINSSSHNFDTVLKPELLNRKNKGYGQ